MGLQYVDLQIMLRIIGELCGKKRWRAALINNPLIYWTHFSLLSQSQTQLIFRINHCRQQQCEVRSPGRQCELMARFKMFILSKESHGNLVFISIINGLCGRRWNCNEAADNLPTPRHPPASSAQH